MECPAPKGIPQNVNPNIPDSWYEDPQNTSELNITEFNQSPFNEKVAERKLPHSYY